jgi:sulfur carrier protein
MTPVRLVVNGRPREAAAGSTVADLLAALSLEGGVAVAVDGQVVPRSAHATHVLADGARVEVLRAVGGG